MSGIDLDEQGLLYANENCLKTKQKYKTSEYEIRNADASQFEIPQSVNLIFMFNPFGEETMKLVINHILLSYKKFPRTVWVLYQNPICENIFFDK